MLRVIHNAAKSTQPTQTSESVTHIPFSSALTHLLEQVSKLEIAEASCSENNVDFRILRDCLASYVAGSSTPSKTAGGMDLVLPWACQPRSGFVSCRADPRAYFNRGAGVQALHAGAAKAPFADEV